jgi:hypothetical protein
MLHGDGGRSGDYVEEFPATSPEHYGSQKVTPSTPSRISPDEPVSTLMVRNLHTATTGQELMQYLAEAGLGSAYDYINIPQSKPNADAKTLRKCKGYAFVNFIQCMRPSELHAALSRTTMPKKDRVVIVSAVLQGVVPNLESMVSTKTGSNKAVVDLFTNVWVRVNGGMEAMEAPLAHKLYTSVPAHT